MSASSIRDMSDQLGIRQSEQSTDKDAAGNADAAPCEHGLLVGLAETADPRECQSCDWCMRCDDVRRYDGDTCATCGRIWGACETCNVDPCECAR